MTYDADDLYRRTMRAVDVRDSLVRDGVRWLEARGINPISATVIVVWAIERASVERITRAQWPA